MSNAQTVTHEDLRRLLERFRAGAGALSQARAVVHALVDGDFLIERYEVEVRPYPLGEWTVLATVADVAQARREVQRFAAHQAGGRRAASDDLTDLSGEVERFGEVELRLGR